MSRPTEDWRKELLRHAALAIASSLMQPQNAAHGRCSHSPQNRSYGGSSYYGSSTTSSQYTQSSGPRADEDHHGYNEREAEYPRRERECQHSRPVPYHHRDRLHPRHDDVCLPVPPPRHPCHERREPRRATPHCRYDPPATGSRAWTPALAASATQCEDNRLRQQALASRTAVDLWRHDLPDIGAAMLSDHGHPIFPPGTPTDYGAAVREPDTRHRYEFFEMQALNIMSWELVGEHTAFNFATHLVERMEADPTAACTEGEVLLLQCHYAIDARYRTVRGEAPRPRPTYADRTNRVTYKLEPRPEYVKPQDAVMTYAAPAPTTAPALDSEPAPAPHIAPPPAATVAMAYLGSSPPLNDDNTVVILTELDSDTPGRPTTQSILELARRWILAVPTAHRPHGMRVMENEFPTVDETSLPLAEDVGAWFTINGLAPRRGRISSINRAKFLHALAQTLSVEGIFNHYVSLGQYIFANLPFEHYPFSAMNICASQIIAWLIQHGITPGSGALRALESFARSRRNYSAYSGNPVNRVFTTGFPHCEADVARIVVHDEDRWGALRHAALQEGVQSDYPACPGVSN
ncbi:hypothetical protein C8J57DRAFT_1514619 [Mycena rebaudengoi]|nr:hypothetical protein C8J57DRAFT_1514619 [Mycena rebaudengoi]